MAELTGWVVLALVELAEPARGSSVAPCARPAPGRCGDDSPLGGQGPHPFRREATDEITAEELFFQRVRSVELARAAGSPTSWPGRIKAA